MAHIEMATLNLSWWQSWYLNVDPQPISSVLDDHNIPFKREQRSGTLTIVDWDDTLFPYVARHNAAAANY